MNVPAVAHSGLGSRWSTPGKNNLSLKVCQWFTQLPEDASWPARQGSECAVMLGKVPMSRTADHLRRLGFFLCALGCLIGPEPAMGHNVGSGLFGHTVLVTVDPEEVKIDYMIEIPTSVLIKEFWEFLEQNQSISTTEKDRYITSIMLKRLARGLLLIHDTTPLTLQETEALQEKTGFGDYNFFQYRIVLKTRIEEVQHPSKLTLVNRNYTGFRGVYFMSVSVTPRYKVAGCSLGNPEQRFLLDPQTGVPWSTWDGNRTLEIDVRAPRIWERADRSTTHVVLDNYTMHERSSGGTPPRESGSLSGKGDSTTGKIGRVLHQKELSPALILAALGMAILLGAAHALSPGHGKSMVAAYLVGTRGRARDAIMLGCIVTFSHVFSVILLGICTLMASHFFVPEQMLPYLEVGSGILIFLLGIYVLWNRWPRSHENSALFHSSEHTPPHSNGGHHVHPHPEDIHTAGQSSSLRTRELFMLGVSGGIVPCPSALVILLMALALHRLLLGLALVIAFSIGLALVLITTGLLMVWVGSSFLGVRDDRPLFRWLPVASGFVIIIVGIIMVARSVWEGRVISF